MDEIATVAERSDVKERRFTWEARLVQASPLGVTLTSVLVSLLIFATYLLCVWWNDLPIVVSNASVNGRWTFRPSFVSAFIWPFRSAHGSAAHWSKRRSTL